MSSVRNWVRLAQLVPPVLAQTMLVRSPEDCFTYAWKSELLDRTLAQVQAGRESTHAQALEHERILAEAQKLFETRGLPTRGTSDPSSDAHVVTPEQIALHAPVWIEIGRKGDRVSSFYSVDGATWTPMAWNPQTVAMPDSVYIGLAPTSHDTRKAAEARISHVTTTGDVTPPGPFTQSQDIRLQLSPSPNAADPHTIAWSNPLMHLHKSWSRPDEAETWRATLVK